MIPSPMDDLIGKAMALAARVHRGQRYGPHPYLFHLMQVVANLERFGVSNPDLEAAAWLHDAVEDTDLTLEDVRGALSARVAELVDAVTVEDGPNRKTRYAKTYPKIKATPGAVALKLADRIANVEHSWATRDSRLFMYQREYRDFRSALRDPAAGQTKPMWDHLDGLLGFRR